MDFAKILNDAHNAASAAILAKFKCGEREQPFNCGFAWVTIDGTSPLARYCRAEVKKAGGAQHASSTLGSKGYPRGWQFWKPGTWPTKAEAGVDKMYEQDMDFHVAGARAFQEVLAQNGYSATVGSRLD